MLEYNDITPRLAWMAWPDAADIISVPLLWLLLPLLSDMTKFRLFGGPRGHYITATASNRLDSRSSLLKSPREEHARPAAANERGDVVSSSWKGISPFCDASSGRTRCCGACSVLYLRLYLDLDLENTLVRIFPFFRGACFVL